MPTIPCPDCQTVVSDRAAACPKCGRPIKAARTTGRITEAAGTILVVAGIGIAYWGSQQSSDPIMAGGVIAFAAGLIVFIVGRFL